MSARLVHRNKPSPDLSLRPSVFHCHTSIWCCQDCHYTSMNARWRRGADRYAASNLPSSASMHNMVCIFFTAFRVRASHKPEKKHNNYHTRQLRSIRQSKGRGEQQLWSVLVATGKMMRTFGRRSSWSACSAGRHISPGHHSGREKDTQSK